MNHSATGKCEPGVHRKPLGRRTARQKSRGRNRENSEPPEVSKRGWTNWEHLSHRDHPRTWFVLGSKWQRDRSGPLPKSAGGESQLDHPSTGYPTARLHIVKNAEHLGTEAGQLSHTLRDASSKCNPARRVILTSAFWTGRNSGKSGKLIVVLRLRKT